MNGNVGKPVTAKFDIERNLVGRLFDRLGIAIGDCVDPNAAAGRETGVDVAVVLDDGRQIGIQVTELDTGGVPGVARAEEMRSFREAHARGSSVYGGWGQNDPRTTVDAIARAINRKIAIADRHDLSGYDGVWLLICAGVPRMGAPVSTIVMTPWLEPGALNGATAGSLGQSKYGQAFLLCILGVEKALYRWRPTDNWTKQVVAEPSELQGPSVFDVLRSIRDR